MTVSVETKTITPTKAKDLLKRNTDNRPVKNVHLESMTRDMLSGRWAFNGDAIRISADGELLDGQHRLMACVASKTPFETVMITGLPASAKDTIDGGAKRSYSDRLALRGYKYSGSLSAAARLLHQIAYDNYNHRGLTTAEMDKILSANSGLVTSVAKAHGAFPKIQALLMALHYIVSVKYTEAEADAFLNVWKTGVPAYAGDPVHTLREKVIRVQNTPKDFRRFDLYRLVIHTMNMFLKGEKLKMVRHVGEVKVPKWTPSDVGV